MSSEEKVNKLELLEFDKDFIIKKSHVPILFTAPHTMEQIRDDGSIKPSETFTKAIALYLNKYFNVNCMIKIKDPGEDSNKDNRDEFKTKLIRFIKDNNIKLVIDLHGSKKEREFDIEFGTTNNLIADFSTIKELEEAFIEGGIKNKVHNDSFKGGLITQYIYGIKEVDLIQLEINSKFRDPDNIDKLEMICKSLGNFIKQYIEHINR